MKSGGIWIVSLILAASLLLSSCTAGNTPESGDAAAGEADRLNTATSLIVGQNQNYFPIIVAYEKGFLYEEFGDEVTVEVPTFSNGPAQNESVKANQIDIANMGDLPTIQLWASDVDIEVISYLWDSPSGYTLVANRNSGLETLADLKGKNIAIQFGSNMHKLLLKFLESQGYTVDDVNMINLQIAEANVALQEGTVDAVIVAEPTSSQLLQNQDLIAVSTAEGYDRVITVMYGRGTYLRQNPEIISRYLKVMDETNRWIAQNPEEAVDIVAAFMGTTDIEGTRTYYEARTWIAGTDQDLVDILNDTIAFCLEQGLISRDDLDAQDLVNGAYAAGAGLQS